MKSYKSTTPRRSATMLAVLLCMIAFSLPLSAAKSESLFSRQVSRTFSAGNGDKLDVSNIYGNITLTHWDKPNVSIEVKVTLKAKSKEDAQNLLDDVEIEMEKSGATVLARTNLTGNRNFKDLKVNYTIFAPVYVGTSLDQRYGNITTDDFKAPLKVKCRYGKVSLGSVVNADIDVDYCNDCTLGNANNLDLNFSYSGLTMGNANNIQADFRYSNLKAGKISKADASFRYSNLRINDIGTLKLSLDYGNFDCERLTGSLMVPSFSYSNMTVSNLNPEFKAVDISCRYSNVNISVAKTASFKVDANGLKYGSCKVDGFTVRNRNNSSGFDSRRQTSESCCLDVNGGNGGTIVFDGGGYSKFRIKASVAD